MTADPIERQPDHIKFSGRILFLTEDTSLIRRQLDTYDLGRRLGSIRTRLVTADGRLTAAVVRTHHQSDARFRSSASQLDSLSPLAVLARGYAVCWDANRARALRNASDVTPGDSVRVTLAKGELRCDVRETKE